MSIPTRDIPNPILDILAECTVTDGIVYLPPKQLDRADYVAVNRVLESLGGKWNRKAKGHTFADDPADRLADVVTTGQYANPDDMGWFPTPEPLAREVVELAGITRGWTDDVLEPSAGEGALADLMAEKVGQPFRVTCCELDPKRADILNAKGYATHAGDFLTWHPAYHFRYIVMNPPFARQQDIDHVNHAWSLLAPGGRLVAIMSKGTEFRSTGKAKAFRELVAAHGRITPNPDDAFRESGTLVRTITVVLDKPEAA